ncbi:MAG: hypothetical protein ACLPL5_06980 [Stellaceae bacterium]
MSVGTEQGAVERALEAERAEAPRRHTELQLTRLQRALPVVDAALQEGDLEAVSALVLTVGEMDRCPGLAAAELEPPQPAAPRPVT